MRHRFTLVFFSAGIPLRLPSPLNPIPAKSNSGYSGGDLGVNSRSLEMELREAQESAGNAAPPRNPTDTADFPLDLKVEEVESRIDADVRELMASVKGNGDLSPGVEGEMGWWLGLVSLPVNAGFAQWSFSVIFTSFF